MDLEKGIKIDKINRSNFHIWKPKAELILAYREVDDVVEWTILSSRPKDPVERKKWEQCDRQACAIIRLSLSDDLVESVKGSRT